MAVERTHMPGSNVGDMLEPLTTEILPRIVRPAANPIPAARIAAIRDRQGSFLQITLKKPKDRCIAAFATAISLPFSAYFRDFREPRGWVFPRCFRRAGPSFGLWAAAVAVPRVDVELAVFAAGVGATGGALGAVFS